MARVTARNTSLFAGARDISGRANTATMAFSSEAPDDTCFGAAYRERLSGGLKDYELSFAGFGDFSASQVDETMRSLMSSSAWYGVYRDGSTASKRGREIIGIANNYTIEGAVEGAIGYSATVTGSTVMLDMSSLAHTTLTVAGCSNQSSVDFVAANSGTCWHLFRVLTLSGTNPEVSACVQESADDGTWVTIQAWTSLSSANQIFTTTTASCSRYRRVAASLSGTSPCAMFMVCSGSAK